MTGEQKELHVVVVDFSNHHFIKDAVANLDVPDVRVSYVYSADFQSPNKRNASNNYESEAIAVSLGSSFKKYSLIQRRFQEKAWSKACAAVLEDLAPDSIIAANCPVDVLEYLHRWAAKSSVGFGVWVQDIYGPIMTRLLGRSLRAPGRMIGNYYTRREHKVFTEADLLISIDPSLSEHLKAECGRTDAYLVPNWAAVDDLPVVDKRNSWAERHGLADTRNAVYTGTLGMKHSPSVLVDLAKDLADIEDARVVVVSEGMGADYLAEAKREHGLDNLVLLPFQDPDQLAQVLGAADVCCLLLNESASDFCIPSKVLGYMCAARPVVGALPLSNPVARLVAELEIGEVVASDDSAGFAKHVRELMLAPYEKRTLMGKRARIYAEREFARPVVEARLSEVVTALVNR